MKKITQTSAASLSGVLSEVMLLSRLNNPFIVRYYAAWIEAEDQRSHSSGEDSSSENSEDEAVSDSAVSTWLDSASRGLDFISSGGNMGFEFGYDTDDEDAGSQAVMDEDSGDRSLPLRAGNPHKSSKLGGNARRRSNPTQDTPVNLYIQMEYCERQTLRDLIRTDL